MIIVMERERSIARVPTRYFRYMQYTNFVSIERCHCICERKDDKEKMEKRLEQ